MFGIGPQQRQQIVRRGFDEIDLAVAQGIHLRLRIGNPNPFDAIDFCQFAASKSRWRLRARLILRVFEVDGLLARPPLVLLENKGPRAGGIGDLGVGIRLCHALGHHEWHVGCRLAERRQHQAVGLLQPHDKGLGVGCFQFADKAHQFLRHAVACRPALERGDAILCRHRGPVMPLKAIAQREGPGELVLAHGPGVDHLRPDRELFIEREQRVIDHEPVMGADQRRGPDRIDDFEIRMQRDFQRTLGRGGRHDGQMRRQNGRDNGAPTGEA